MNENENINLNNDITTNMAPSDGPVNITKPDANIESTNNISIDPNVNAVPVNNVSVDTNVNATPVNNVSINPNVNTIPVNNVSIDPNVINNASADTNMNTNQANNVFVNPTNFGNPMNNNNQYSAPNYNQGAPDFAGTVNVNTPPVNNMPPQQKPKKKGALVGILIAATLVIIVGIVAFLFLFTTTFKSPKQKVMLALSRTFGNQSFIAELSGNTKKGISKGVRDESESLLTSAINTTNALKDTQYETEYSLKLENISNDGSSLYQEAYGAGINGTSIVNAKDKLAYNNLSVNYNGFNVIDVDAYVDDSVMMLAADDLFDGYIAIDTTKVGDKLEGSYLGDLLESRDAELFEKMCEIDFNYFDSMNQAAKNGGKNLPLLNSKDIKPLTDLYKNIEVKSNNTYATYEIGDKKVKAYNYNVHIPKEAALDFANDFTVLIFDTYKEYVEENEDVLASLNVSSIDEFYDKLDELQDSFDELLVELEDNMEDIDFQVYIDNKCRLIAIKYEGIVENDHETYNVDFNMEFTGATYLCNEIYTELNVSGEDNEDDDVNIKSLYSVTEEKTNKNTTFYIDASTNSYVCTLIDMQYNYDTKKGDYDLTVVLFDGVPQTASFTLASDGMIEVTSDSFDFEFDSISLTEETAYGSEISIELSGNLSMAPSKEEIELPDGPEYDIYEIDESDIMELGEEIYENLSNSPIFGNLF